jgi:exosortase B
MLNMSAASSQLTLPKADLPLVAVGLVLMYLPTYVALDQTVWNVVGQGHGPVIFALTCWLAWQRWPELVKLPPQGALPAGAASIVFGLLLYILGRSQDVLMFDAGSQIFVVSGVLLLYWGVAGLKTMWFPLFFLLFLIPLPAAVVDAATGPLKSAVSMVAEQVLFFAGYPVGRSGVTLTVGPYQLLVADACAGLNSIFALEAVGVFYMSIVLHPSKWRNILLASLILPISFVSNVLRVVALVLVTYYFGDEAGQGFVHDFAGILLFAVATLLTIGVDTLLGMFFWKSKPANAIQK